MEHYRHNQDSVGRGYRGKRALDLTLLLIGAPFWVPVMLVTAALVRAKLGAPILFQQQRAGKDGKIFSVRKFRSMTDERDASGALLPDDKRLTAFGKRLRSTSLDELPELLNVFRGEMSLVGPRPLLAQYLPLYSELHRHRHDVAPGITGLAQISGRNAISWASRFDLDVEYVRNASIRLDLWILAQTIKTVFSRRGVSAEGMATMSYFRGYDDD